MRYSVLLMVILFSGCYESTSSAECKALGYKGVVSEPTAGSYQYCSNGELVNGAYLTNHGAIRRVYNVRGAVYTYEYLEFK